MNANATVEEFLNKFITLIHHNPQPQPTMWNLFDSITLLRQPKFLDAFSQELTTKLVTSTNLDLSFSLMVIQAVICAKLLRPVLGLTILDDLLKDRPDSKLAWSAQKYIVNCNVYVPFLVLSVGTACSLKCKDCANFIPFVKQKYYPVEKVLGDFRKFCQAVIGIEDLQIQGGEAFGHPKITEILAGVHEINKELNNRIKKIRFATNATYLMKPELVDLCKKTNTVVRISNYSGVPGLNDKIDRLSQQLEEAGIEYYIYEFVYGKTEWSELGGIDRKRDDFDEQKIQTRFESCAFNSCVTLENGLLGKCSRSTTGGLTGLVKIDKIGFVNFDAHTNDQELQEAIRVYLSNRVFMEACRSCNGSLEGTRVQPGLQLEKAYKEKLPLLDLAENMVKLDSE